MSTEAVLAQLFALRAMVDATIVLVQSGYGTQAQAAPPLDPATTCPTCGADGESQQDISTIGAQGRRRCANCRTERSL